MITIIINAWDASCMISSSNKFAVLWIAHNTFILHYWYLAMSVCSRSCQISHAHFLFFKLPTPPPFPFQTSNVYFRSLRWALFPFRTTRTRRKKDTHIQRNQRFHLLEYLEGVVYDLEGWSSAETCIRCKSQHCSSLEAWSCWKFSWKYYINTINPPRYDIPREVFLSWAFRKIVNVSTKRMVQFPASTEISEHRLIVLIFLRQFIYKC